MRLDISLVIPVYDQAKELEITLAHFITLLYETEDIKTEIIIVDDGSNDNVKQILEDTKKGEDRIRIISQKHQGRRAFFSTVCPCTTKPLSSLLGGKCGVGNAA